MKRFTVQVLFCGYIQVEIEAESDDEAINKAIENGYCNDDIVEMDLYKNAIEGHICYLPCYKAEIVDEEEI